MNKTTPPTVSSQSITGPEMVTTRIIDAPPELVFKMWTDPHHVAQWWGPNGFTTTVQEMDVRPGGAWRLTLHGPDGVDYANKSVYVEVVKPQRIVFDHISHPKFQMTATFDEVSPDKTKVTMRMVFDSPADLQKVIKEFGAAEGAKQTIARLGDYVTSTGRNAVADSISPPFVISRTFNAPRELVWKAWTEPAHLMRWFGPKGFTMPACKLDFRPGGTFHYSMRSPPPANMEMWGKFVYREIVPMERIVLVNSFSDEKGGITRHPMSPTWPLEMLTTTTFAEHQGQTTVTLRWSPLNATDEERKTFDAGHGSMAQGWTGTFDQLAEYLAKL